MCVRTDVVYDSLAVDDHGACERFDGSARPDRAEQNRSSGQSALLEAVPVTPRPKRVTARENPPDHAATDAATQLVEPASDGPHAGHVAIFVLWARVVPAQRRSLTLRQRLDDQMHVIDSRGRHDAIDVESTQPSDDLTAATPEQAGGENRHRRGMARQAEPP